MDDSGAGVMGRASLRPTTDADRPFLLDLYGSTRQEELDLAVWGEGQREAFLRMQFDIQDAAYRRSSPNGTFDLIEVGGRPAGRLYVDRGPDDYRIIDIALLPEHRGQGIGGALIAALQREAAEADAIVSLHVGLDNRAARLYERLGFVTTGEAGIHRLMEWSPQWS